MNPLPKFEDPNYKGSEKLKGKNVLITGGDSGIGRAVSIAFAKEGANIAIAYLDEDEDATETKQLVEKEGVNCVLLPGDLSNEQHCKEIVEETAQQLGGLNVLVNNVAQQYPQQGLEYITAEQLEKTFRINICQRPGSTRWVCTSTTGASPPNTASAASTSRCRVLGHVVETAADGAAECRGSRPPVERFCRRRERQSGQRRVVTC